MSVAGKFGNEKQELPEHKLVNAKNRSGLAQPKFFRFFV